MVEYDDRPSVRIVRQHPVEPLRLRFRYGRLQRRIGIEEDLTAGTDRLEDAVNTATAAVRPMSARGRVHSTASA